MSSLNYFTKTSISVAVSKDTGSVSLAQTNEGSRRPEGGDSCATEVETSVTPIVSESGRNLKRKTVSAPKRRRWRDDYVMYGFYRAREEEHSLYPFANCLFCSVKYANSNLVPSKLELHLKKQPNTSLSLRSLLSLNYLHCIRSKKF